MSVQNWSVACNLGPIVGRVTVDREETSAAICTAAVRIGTGQDITSYIGDAMTISGLFTGVVNSGDYDETTGICLFRGSDLLQETFEVMTEAQILAAITGGKYATEIFGDREDGWQQALDVLSTVTKEAHLDVAGSLVVTDWDGAAPGAWPSTAIWGTPKSVPARRRDIVNRININFDVRFTRLHHREHLFSWTGYSVFCTYFQNPHSLPLRDMVQSAADGAGWLIQNGIGFGTHPDTGLYTCFGSPVGWSVSEELQNQIAVNANWTGVRRWTQTITETYTLTVENTVSQSAYGIQTQEDGGTYVAEYDDAQWDQSIEAATPTGTGWSGNAIGDWAKDEITRTDPDNALETILSVASTKIKSTHRRNFLTYEIAYNASLEIGDTIGSGKIYQLTHNLDTNSGRATTTVRVAYSAISGGAADALDAPAPPDTQPTHQAPASFTVLPTRIACIGTPDVFDEEWVGYTGNYSQCTPGVEVYPNRFRVVTPDIEDESRDEATGEVIETFGVSL